MTRIKTEYNVKMQKIGYKLTTATIQTHQKKPQNWL